MTKRQLMKMVGQTVYAGDIPPGSDKFHVVPAVVLGESTWSPFCMLVRPDHDLSFGLMHGSATTHAACGHFFKTAQEAVDNYKKKIQKQIRTQKAKIQVEMKTLENLQLSLSQIDDETSHA